MMKQMGRKIHLSLIGIGRVLKRPRYLLLSIFFTAIFLFAFNLFASGDTYIQLILNLPLPEKFEVIWMVYQNLFLNIFHLDKLIILILSVAEGILISLMVFAIRRQRSVNDESLIEGGIAALLALVSAGCPVCGGVALLPLLATFFGLAVYAWLSTIYLIVAILALALMFFALRKQGFICYTLTNAEMIQKQRKEKEDE